ncbi:MAG: hypothetical protein AAGM22_11255 [Acidobacteriota bacterium]
MIHNALRLAVLVSIVLVATRAEAVPNLDRVIATQLEEVAARPGDPSVHNDLGNLLVLAERLEEAERSYRKAKELSPADSSARFNLGLLLQQQERFDEAFTELSELIEIEPKHAWAHYQLGMLEVSRGNRSGALEFYARSFALDPTLTFERNNPHIIDNELATEALLRSSQFRRSAASTIPRSYGEGARLREVMLEEAEAEMEAEIEAEMKAEAEVEEELYGESAAAPGPRDRRSATSGRSTLPTESASDDPPLGRGFGEDEDEGDDEEDEPSLRGGRSVSGIAIGGSGAQAGTAGTARSTDSQPVGRAQPPAGVDDQSRRDAIRERLRGRSTTSESPRVPASRGVTAAPDRPAPTPSYRPSRRSSASLDLELLDDVEGGARGM